MENKEQSLTEQNETEGATEEVLTPEQLAARRDQQLRILATALLETKVYLQGTVRKLRLARPGADSHRVATMNMLKAAEICFKALEATGVRVTFSQTPSEPKKVKLEGKANATEASASA